MSTSINVVPNPFSVEDLELAMANALDLPTLSNDQVARRVHRLAANQRDMAGGVPVVGRGRQGGLASRGARQTQRLPGCVRLDDFSSARTHQPAEVG
jgi:hypothetical protein